jgi:Acyl-CoA carboxylase epsilon subunit
VSEEQREGVDIRFVGGNPTAEEIAAVTAVLSATVEELAAERDGAAPIGPDAWQRSQRGLRGTITPGYGAWRSFSA